MKDVSNLCHGDYLLRIWKTLASASNNALLYKADRYEDIALPVYSQITHEVLVAEIKNWLRYNHHSHLAIAYKLLMVTIPVQWKSTASEGIYLQSATAQTFVHKSRMAIDVVKKGRSEILVYNEFTRIALNPDVVYKPVTNINRRCQY